MANVDILNRKNKKVKSLEVSDEIFSCDVNRGLLYAAVKWQRAKARAGSASTKTRADVNHSTSKPFRQKGSGRARQGMTSSPILEGGGVVFGPKPRDYSYKLNRKMKKGALRSAISYKNRNGKLLVVDSLEMEEVKTKEIKKILDALKVSSALVVDETNENLSMSIRNLRASRYLNRAGLNVYDILKHEYLVITERALSSLAGLTEKPK